MDLKQIQTIVVSMQLFVFVSSHHHNDHMCRHPHCDDCHDDDYFLCHRPLTAPDDTICGTTNSSLILCHMHRAQYNALFSDVLWINVCLFQPEKPQDNFVDLYNCRVTNGLGPVNCTSKTDPMDTFLRGCIFTFYPCRKHNISECHRTYARELEDGGSCAAEGNWCPSKNLYSLTTPLLCSNVTYKPLPINFTNLTVLSIRLPTHCLFPYDAPTVVFYVIGIFGLLAGIAIGVWRIKKIANKSRVNNHDVTIQSVEAVLGTPEEVHQFNEPHIAEEAPHSFNPVLYVERGGSDYSRDTGFDEPAVNSDALSVVSEVEHEESCNEVVDASPAEAAFRSTPRSQCVTSKQLNTSIDIKNNHVSLQKNDKSTSKNVAKDSDVNEDLQHCSGNVNDISHNDDDQPLPSVTWSSDNTVAVDSPLYNYMRKSDLDVETWQ